MASIGEITVNVALDVPDRDAQVCARLLEIYLNKHADKYLEVEKLDDGSTAVLLMSMSEPFWKERNNRINAKKAGGISTSGLIVLWWC